MAGTQDTEITLGTGKLLGIFFGLAILCAVFFTMGYMLGHTASAAGATTQIAGAASGSNSSAKPSAGNRGGSTASADSSIYNSTKPGDNQADSQGVNQVTPSPDTKPADQGDNARSAPPELKNAGSGSYMVQVAAVSKQEDAEILVTALRKKQYPVFIVSNVPGDSLFHVQVGPFTDPKDAESMRSRLAGDGYNAIVKR